MKIAILIEDIAEQSGGKRVAVNLANELAKKYDIVFINWYKRKQVYELNTSVNIVNLLKKKDRLYKDFFILIKNLRNTIINNDIKKIIIIGRYVSSIAFLSTIGLNCKLIICEHNSLFGYKVMQDTNKKIIMDKIIKFCYIFFKNQLVFLTSRDVNTYKNNLLIKRKSIYNIYNWIDDKLIIKNKTSVYNTNSKYILTIGRLDYQKGYEYLISVAEKIFQQYPNWEWHIYGNGDEKYKSKLDNLIKRYKLENNIRFKGIHDNIYDVYEHYSFFVMTSRFEGLPMVLLEAKASRLPIVSFDIETGPSEIIQENINGFLIKPFDVEEMSKKICKLISDPQLRKNFSDNSYKNINKFSKEMIIKQWIKLIDNRRI